MYYPNQSSLHYQAYESVGALSMVMPQQIQQQQNIGYLQDLCLFIDKMKINPLWYEAENSNNKLKLIQVYQMAINYSKNLSTAYQREIQALENTNKQHSLDIEMQVRRIKQHKEKVSKTKQNYKLRKYKKIKNEYKRLKQQMRQEEQEEYEHYDRRQSNNQSYSQQNQNRFYGFNPQFPPGYYPPVNYPVGINSNPHSMNSNSTTVKQSQGQYPPVFVQQQPQQNQGFSQQQLGQNVFQLFQNVNNKNASQQQKKIQDIEKIKEPEVKQIDDSYQMEEEECPQAYKNQLQQSQIVGKNKMQPQLPVQPSRMIGKSKIIKSNQRSQLKPQMEKAIKNSIQIGVSSGDNDFEGLDQFLEKSKIGGNSKNNLSSKNSKQHNNSAEEQQFNSIAQIRLGKQSNITKNLRGQSKIQKKVIKQQNKSISNDRESGQQQKPSASSEDQLSLLSNIAQSKFSRNPPSETKNLHKKKPERASLMNKQRQQQNQGENGFGSIILNPVSKVTRQSEKQKRDDNEDFGGILQSNNLKKQLKAIAGKDNVELKNKSQMQRPKGESYLKIQQNRSEELSKSNNSKLQSATVGIQIPKSNRLELPEQGGLSSSKNQDFSNIFQSNIGKKGNRVEQVNQMEKPPSNPRPKRASQIQKQKEELQKESNSKTPPKLQKQPVNEEQQDNYEDQPFEQELDLGNLEVSHHPAASKNAKKQSEGSNQLDVPIPKSSVNLVIPSTKSLDQLSKYVKIKDEVFTLKQIFNRPSIEQTKIERSSYQDPFDFIASIPANSVIAKRPVPKSKIIQLSKVNKQPSSLKNVSGNALAGSQSQNPSINLISPHNEKVKLVERQNVESGKSKQQSGDDSPNCYNLKGQPFVSKVLKKQQKPKEEEQKVQKKIQQGDRQKEEKPKKNKQDKDEQQPDDSYSDSSSGKLSILHKSVEYSKKQKPVKGNQLSHRKQILLLIKKAQALQPSVSKKQKVDERMIFQALEEINQFNKRDFNDAGKVIETNKLLDKMIRQLESDNSKKKVIIDKAVKDAKIQQKPAKKEAQYSPFNDSLKYSQSLLKQPSKAIQKNIEVDIAESIDFKQVLKNPYTPQEPLQKKEEIRQNNQLKKQQKGNNRYLRQTKPNGPKQQDALLKNVGEGIIKYDQDDDLNREIRNLINLKKGKLDSKLPESGDGDEWD